MAKPVVIGLVESVVLEGRKKLRARVDTGATVSSMDKRLAEELGLIAGKKTKTVRSASGTSVRKVVRAGVWIAKEHVETEFTIAERSHLSYPLLIGQNTLKKLNILIDPKQ